MVGRHPIDHLAALAVQLQDVAVFQDEGILLGGAHGLGQEGVFRHVAVFPMDGNEETGVHQAQEHLQFFLGGVPAYVNIGDAGM